MKYKNLQNNRGFVLLFAVTLSALLLAIAVGVTNIAFREIRFSTNAIASNDAFFAADTGIECALFHDKSANSVFDEEGGIVQCLGGDGIDIEDSSPWSFTISGFGSSNKSCVHVTVTKDPLVIPITTIVSKGYNVGEDDGDGTGCVSSDPNRVERQLEVRY